MIKQFLCTTALVAIAAVSENAAFAQGNNPNTPDPIVGTWVVKVPGPTPADTFYAIHTFHQGGTFTEVSSLLQTGAESPAKGVWSRQGNDYLLKFILFTFDEEGHPSGYVQVRGTLKLTGDRLDATTEVDVIEPDGNIIPNVASGPYFGLRQKLNAAGMKAEIPPFDAVESASRKSSHSGEAAGGKRQSQDEPSAAGRKQGRLRTWSGMGSASR